VLSLEQQRTVEENILRYNQRRLERELQNNLHEIDKYQISEDVRKEMTGGGLLVQQNTVQPRVRMSHLQMEKLKKRIKGLSTDMMKYASPDKK